MKNHNLGSSIELSKEHKKILRGENRETCSDGTVSNFFSSHQSGYTKAYDDPPRKNVMTYDSFYQYRPSIIRGRTYIPMLSYSGKLPIIIFFHGGGFIMHEGSIVKYDNFCRRLALELPCVIVSINYPHAPKHKCPAQYDAASEYMRFYDTIWTSHKHGYYKSKHTDMCNVYLAGDEAGGNIAHELAIRILSKKFKLKQFVIKGLISIQPLFGGEARTESEIKLSKSPMLTLKQRDGMWKSFLPNGYDRDCKEVNVSGPNNPIINLQKFPKTLLIVGGLDPLQDWQKRYYIWLQKCGVNATLVQYPGGIPQFHLYPKLPESKLVIDEIRSFIYNNV